MKMKKIKLTKEQIDEIEMLEESLKVADSAFERASQMLSKAEGGLWHYLVQEYPEIEKSRQFKAAGYHRGTKTIEYGLPGE